jgi:hypothetical protein
MECSEVNVEEDCILRQRKEKKDLQGIVSFELDVQFHVVTVFVALPLQQVCKYEYHYKVV